MTPSSSFNYRELAELKADRGKRKELDRLSLAEGGECTWGEVMRGVSLRFLLCVFPEFTTFPLRVPVLEPRIVVVGGGGANTSMTSSGANRIVHENLRGGGRSRIDRGRARRRNKRGEYGDEREKGLLRGEIARISHSLLWGSSKNSPSPARSYTKKV
ncbi:hypothetical protein K435DRAFT_855811 [Dendrothele bispora CBS 962.96]|uniref:Uncharacterized protein n=1 Tax=Dendrothele bispora (strain CBS 962.96) TaxID=1314807 RepID=A0A4V4HGK9_DENBC|nr:hypothetical protein K435DRAFT_855811 [Dendrothele bispora CBS 962.96]